ncbi:MAG: hypothetical protein NZM15_09570 [Flavobacteriales bacterium]|nr:hypothetical protein [Flavobacteriales bacterium]MDW8432936.1 hypothetical protein [Flavobacteriales bacterium]
MQRKAGFVCMEIVFTYAPWWLIPGLILSVLLTGLTYWRNPRFAPLPRKALALAALARWAALALTSLLITGPMLRLTREEEEKPLVLFLTDNSASMTLHADSAEVRDRLRVFLDSLKSQLSDDFQVIEFAFGVRLQSADSLNFTARSSAYARAMTEALEAVEGRRLRAVVLTGDGRFNDGPSPLYAARALGVPVFCLMTGDTLSMANAALSDLRYNQVTLAGNRFPVEATVEFYRMKGRQAVVELRDESGRLADRQEILVPEDRSTRQVTLWDVAEKPGVLAYKVIVRAGEETYQSDNIRKFFIEALNSKVRILLAADAPHPDIGALRLALERNKNLEVALAVGEPYPDNIQAYNLLVLHQIPGYSSSGLRLLKQVLEQRIPFWLITGPNTSAQGLQQAGAGLVLASVLPGRTDDYYFAVNPGFSAFEIDAVMREFLEKLPPLETAFGNYQLPPSSEVLFYRRVGGTVSALPVAACVTEGGVRRMFWLGSGLWRWRMLNFEKQKNTAYFDNLVEKLVQFLNAASDKSRFRLQAPVLMDETQHAVFRAELYNPSYEPVSSGFVELTLIDSAGRKFAYTMVGGSQGYALDAGYLPPGKYSYEARARLGQETFSKKGILVVEALDKERRLSGSDFNTLLGISMESNGAARPWLQAQDMLSLIREKVDARRVIWTHTTLRLLLHQKILFFVILALLTLEWGIRKYYGAY